MVSQWLLIDQNDSQALVSAMLRKMMHKTKLRRMSLVRRLSSVQAIRYIAVGGTSFVIEMSCLLAIYLLLDTSRSVATAVAYWIGLLTAFILQKFIAFKDYQREAQVLTKQGVFYGLLNAWNYVFTLAVVTVVPAKYIVFSRVGAQVVFSCWNYVLYKKVIFKNKVAVPV